MPYAWLHDSDQQDIARKSAALIKKALLPEFQKINKKLDMQAAEIEELKRALVDPYGKTAEKLRAQYGLNKPKQATPLKTAVSKSGSISICNDIKAKRL